ncbi:hypothetical protein [Mycobacteroides abscessus]|uniref:hypothetical protein n=1 Tax=Mycobacteroides abscessus TaxID=36809 RepID=UPI0019CFE435|nr:hypothetical protein [Mycobacteroides abscessus]MBN7411164.1 hypothetical protein [Mycobacteroides abscessus subsp. abscessus]
MARFDDHDATVGADLYAELLAAEEEKFARRGGRRVLVRGRMVVTADVGPLLAGLRAGNPVEISDWQLPHWARNGKVKNRRLVINPAGQQVRE